MSQRIGNPIPTFLDGRGLLLDGGRIYIGAPLKDPEQFPVAVSWKADLSVPAVQPLRTLGGVIVNGESPSFVYADGDDYSLRVRDLDGSEVFFVPSAKEAGQQFQPLDTDLSAIAALATTPYGRGLLTLASQAALKAATGIPDGIPQVGGTVTGNITRAGAGAHIYHADPALGSGRVFVTAKDAADPTTAAGDIWLEMIA